jgi:serine/threonine-protein phosphatase 2A regulatory subunit B'
MFINEIEDIFEVMEASEFYKIQVPLFHQLAKCVSSPHFQVAERALYLWNNEYFCSLMSDNIQTILPIMFAPLHENSKGHWNRYPLFHPSLIDSRTIHGLLYNALKSLIEMDPDLYNKCEEEYEQSCLEAQHNTQERQHRWELLTKAALAAHGQPDSDPAPPHPQETMQIDPPAAINVPEPIPEEPQQQTPDINMADVAPPA